MHRGGVWQSHCRGREKLGHEVRLLPSVYVKPFVKRQKNDAADAEAIAEAASRPTMRFVAVKTEEQQSHGMMWQAHSLAAADPDGASRLRSSALWLRRVLPTSGQQFPLRPELFEKYRV